MKNVNINIFPANTRLSRSNPYVRPTSTLQTLSGRTPKSPSIFSYYWKRTDNLTNSIFMAVVPFPGDKDV